MQEKLQDKGSARRAASKPPNDAPKSPANSFSSAKTVLRAMRIARALQLRGLGFTPAEIGDEEGYSESTACRLVKEGMACLTGRPAKELLAAELSVSIAFAVAVALPVFCAVNGSRRCSGPSHARPCRAQLGCPFSTTSTAAGPISWPLA